MLVCFERVATLGSFTAASQQLQMPRAAVSRLIGALEARVGTTLLLRTTRSVSLTDEGQALVNTALPACARLRTALLDAPARSSGYRGTVRFSVGQAFGQRAVLPALQSFVERYPQIRLDMSVNDKLDDLVAEGLDFAFRVGDLPDSALVARKLAELDVVLAVPASHLSAGTPPRTLAELDAFPLIGFRVPGTQRLYRWQFERAGQIQSRTPTDASLITDSIEDVAQLVCGGMGIAPLPRYLVADQLARGDIVIGLHDYHMPSVPLHICFPGRGERPARVDALADHLVGHIKSVLT